MMTNSELLDMLALSDLVVTFKKRTDGTERVMKITSNVPADVLNKMAAEGEKVSRVKPDGLVTVFDKESRQWRSLYLDSITDVKRDNSTYALLQE